LTLSGLYLFQGIPPIAEATYQLMTDSESQQEVAASMSDSRREITKSHYFGGEYRGQGLIRSLSRSGWAFLLAVCLLVFLQTRQAVWGVLLALLSALTFVFVAGEGTRGPVANVVVYMLVMASLVLRVRPRHVILGLITVAILVVGISFITPKFSQVRQQDNIIYAAGQSIINRITLGNGIHNVHIIELVRSGTLKHRWGEIHLQRVLNSIPGVQYGQPFANELNLLVYSAGPQTTSYASATYLGDIYIDFGLPGVMMVYFVIGLFLATVQSILFKLRRTVLTLPLIAFTVFYAGTISISGFTGFIAEMVVVLLVYFVAVSVSNLVETAFNPRSARLLGSQRERLAEHT
jgi:oligosaccharide repeat unit polymerase